MRSSGLRWGRCGSSSAPRDRAARAPIERWALPLAEALARTHARGWVHNDVKPANVLLGAPDRPLLADFGTARRAGEPSLPGSLGYVSPERLAGRASDPRDDVFGFGRVLEDALLGLEAAPAPDAAPSTPGWLARSPPPARAPTPDRPNDARALVTRLRVEAGGARV